MRSFFFFCATCACILAASIVAGQQASKPQNILNVPAQEMAARLLKTVSPKSPKMPKCSDRMVTLDVVVGVDGKVRSVKAVAGFKEFRRSAVAAVKQWVYKPYLENGKPVPVETIVLVFFPSTGEPGPLFVPDGKGGVKGGDFLPLPQECGSPIKVKPAESQ